MRNPSYAALSTSLSQATHPGTGARREPYEPRHGDDHRPSARTDQLWCGCGLVEGGSTGRSRPRPVPRAPRRAGPRPHLPRRHGRPLATSALEVDGRTPACPGVRSVAPAHQSGQQQDGDRDLELVTGRSRVDDGPRRGVRAQSHGAALRRTVLHGAGLQRRDTDVGRTIAAVCADSIRPSWHRILTSVRARASAGVDSSAACRSLQLFRWVGSTPAGVTPFSAAGPPSPFRHLLPLRSGTAGRGSLPRPSRSRDPRRRPETCPAGRAAEGGQHRRAGQGDAEEVGDDASGVPAEGGGDVEGDVALPLLGEGATSIQAAFGRSPPRSAR